MSNEKETVDTLEQRVSTTFLPAGFSIGSRKVEVRFVSKFSMLPTDLSIRKEQVFKLGSCWRKGTKDIIRALDSAAIYKDSAGNTKVVDEEKRFLPAIIGANGESPNWEERVKEYWANYTFDATLDGLELEVGFKENGLPMSVDGYMKYKWCLIHPFVAATVEELENKANFELYIIDKAKERQKELNEFDTANAADYAYVKLINAKDPEAVMPKIEFMLELEGGERGNGINTLNLSTKEKYFELKKLKERNPSRFLSILNDPHIEIKALIRKAIGVAQLTKEGESYYMGDKNIGTTLMEAVAFLENPNNSDTRLKLVDRVKALTK